MRQMLRFGTLMLLAACGTLGDRPWDQNNDGLITACEGLNARTCDATPGCEREPVACILVCQDDGRGGCLPCPESDVCRPVLPPPTGDCSRRPLGLCAANPACEVVTETVCAAGVGASPDVAIAPPPEGRCGNECHTVQVCQNRRPTTCEQLSPEECLDHRGCAITHDVAEAFAPCAPGGSCERPEVDPLPRCITVPHPIACEQRDLNSCAVDGQCMVEGTGSCDVYCEPGTPCPPCAVGEFRCVPVPPIDHCAFRDPSVCALDGRCMLESYACPAVCEDDGDGGCLPCPAPPVACVPVPPIDECAQRDLDVCSFDGRCMVEAYACPAVCELEADGGCKPCEAPPAVCVPAHVPPPPPSRCTGLDRQSCVAAGCALVELDVACFCDGNGDGGCSPCPDFECVDPAMALDGGRAP